MSSATLLDQVRALPSAHEVMPGWTAADVAARVQEAAAGLRARGVREGEPVGLWLPNGEGWVVALLAVLAAGASPLLMAPDTPEAELRRLLARAEAGRWVTAGRAPGELGLAGEPGPPDPAWPGPEHGVLMTTSGSTGRPTLVLRGEASLLAEAQRYRQALSLDGSARLLLPLPLSHAYALGWLAAALVTGTRVRAVPPTALNVIATELRDGITMVALVPPLARLLASRQLRRAGSAPAPALRLAMIGGGPVDRSLEDTFQAAFGIATARNYGSTETGAMFAGAVFAGQAPLPPLCVGEPMPGVGYRIVDDQGQRCGPGTAGSLWVRPGPGLPWQDTKDLAILSQDQDQDRVTIMGRRHRAIRRGARWVAPLEVEAALREHPQVRDVHVWSQPGGTDGEDILVADIEATGGNGLTEVDLARFARSQLAPYKVPNKIRMREHLTRTPTGKVASARRYRLGGADALLAAARAYRASELLFTLHELGALAPLETGVSPDELADSLSVPVRELDWLLSVAAGMGLVTEDDGDHDAPPPGTAAAVTPFIELESILSRQWLHREMLADTLRRGIEQRQFDHAPADQQLAAVYSRAMHGQAAWQRTALCLRLLKQLPGSRVLEVSAGPGRYLDRLLHQNPSVTGCLVQLGRLGGDLAPGTRAAVADGRVELRADPPPGSFDLCVVANGIHGPHPGSDLRWLLDRIRPAGILVIDDVFLPADGGPGSELGLDWLTHGGIAWPTAESLTTAVLTSGWQVVMRRRLGTSQCHLILATEG